MVVKRHISFLQELIDYTALLVETRLDFFLNPKEKSYPTQLIPRPATNGISHPFIQFVDTNNLDDSEFIILLLAYIPHIAPYLLGEIIQNKLPQASEFPQIGGTRGVNQRSFLPTGETALFILMENDLKTRLELQKKFSPDHFFFKNKVLRLKSVPEGEPRMSGRLILASDFVDLFTLGKISPPQFSNQFPAKKISTFLTKEHIVLPASTLEKLKELDRWLRHGEWLIQKSRLGKRLKPGFSALFYGPPGTGKTLTANILGNEYKRDVYRVDLSQVVSKYIGETEKNLSNLFDRAENEQWILFFDEADALFGKRINIKEAKDKYANQETAYLLQRLEDYPGLVILASNLKDNIDKAFLRRLHSIVYFPFPNAKERIQLWKATLPARNNRFISIDSKVDIDGIAKKYKLTGANINNIVQYCCYLACEQKSKKIDHEMLMAGIRREFEKEGKMV